MFRNLAVKTLVEPYSPIARLMHHLKFEQPKVKLVSIAKNEGRYLAEWIFHHLYFGIDHIEVHYNQCDDNTIALGEHLSSRYPVTFIDADRSFAPHIKSPQVRLYLSAIKKAYKEGFSHILFLDIDEFLIPKDLSKSVKSLVIEKNYFDVISSNWCNKLQDITEFGRALEPTMTLEVSPTVKSMMKTFVTPPKMNPHIVVSTKLRFGMSGQAIFHTDRDDMSKITEHQSRFNQADFFVLHRQYRSQIEYVAMLIRGRPLEAEKIKSIFKNNRRGYNVSANQFSLKFEEKAFSTYSYYLYQHINTATIQRLHFEAEESVKNRYELAVDMIANAPPSEEVLLRRLLKNIALKDVDSACNRMKPNKVNNAS